MLSVQRKKLIEDQVKSLLKKALQMKEIQEIMFELMTKSAQILNIYSSSAHNATSKFEEQIVKNTFYAPNKASWLLAVIKTTNFFILSLERYSTTALHELSTIKPTNGLKINFQTRCQSFMREFHKQMDTEVSFNLDYQHYIQLCTILNQTINKFEFYSSPLNFYNQTHTNDDYDKLNAEMQKCDKKETALKTELQMINTRRKWLSNSIKELNQCYIFILHTQLAFVINLFKKIIEFQKCFSTKEESNPKREPEQEPIDPLEIISQQRVSELYKAQDIFADYKQLFKGDTNCNEVSSNEKFFYERCERVREQKIQSVKETLAIQELFLEQFSLEKKRLLQVQVQYKNLERSVFGINGIDSYRKRFRLHFGQNMNEIGHLCLTLIDKPNKFIEKVMKSIQIRQEKLRKLNSVKKQSLNCFKQKSSIILGQHFQLHEQVVANKTLNLSLLQKFKKSVVESCRDFKKEYSLMEESQKTLNQRYYQQLKQHIDLMNKEYMALTLPKLLSKEKNRLNMLTMMNIDNEIVHILKEDSSYGNLLYESMRANIDFVSKIKRKEYQQTNNILQKKKDMMKKMYREKTGCCGTTSKPVKHQILTKHQNCMLNQVCGNLSVVSFGVLFTQKGFNPFTSKLKLMIPQRDLVGFNCVENKLNIITQMGSLQFISEEGKSIVQSMQKNINNTIVEQSLNKDKFLQSTSLLHNQSFKLNLSTNSNRNDSKSIKNPKKQIMQICCNEKLFNQNYKLEVRSYHQSSIQSSAFNSSLGEKKKEIEISSGEKKIKSQYIYKCNSLSFHLKQLKQCTNDKMMIYFSTKWKVSFPKESLLRSFLHEQKITIDIASNKLSIAEAPMEQQDFFTKNQFYQDVKESHRKLGLLIHNVLQEEVEVVYEKKEETPKKDSSFLSLQLNSKLITSEISKDFGTSFGSKVG